MTNPDPSSAGPPSEPEKPARPRPARPQPKPKGDSRPGEGDAGISSGAGSGLGLGSATGFVGMLARRQFDADMLAAASTDEATRRERLQMAQEVPPQQEEPDAERSIWQKIAFPLALAAALVLLAIGGWAIGALIYMHNVSPLKPQDVHYPLISWRLEIGNFGGYTRASKFMAWTMLSCIPVAVLLVAMGWLVRRSR